MSSNNDMKRHHYDVIGHALSLKIITLQAFLPQYMSLTAYEVLVLSY